MNYFLYHGLSRLLVTMLAKVSIYLRIASLGLTSMHNDETSDVDAGRAVNNEIIFSSK